MYKSILFFLSASLCMLCPVMAEAQISSRIAVPYGGMVTQKHALILAQTLIKFDLFAQKVPVLKGRLEELHLPVSSIQIIPPLLALLYDVVDESIQERAVNSIPFIYVKSTLLPKENPNVNVIAFYEESDQFLSYIKSMYTGTLRREQQRIVLYEQLKVGASAFLLAVPLVLQANNSENASLQLQSMYAAFEENINILSALHLYEENLTGLSGAWTDVVQVQQAMEAVTRLAPRFTIGWLALGEALLQQGGTYEAVQALTQALSLEPKNTMALHVRGLAHLALGQNALAEQDFTTALRYAPEQAEHWRVRGVVRYVTGDLQNMCADFEKACVLGSCEELQSFVKQQVCAPDTAEK